MPAICVFCASSTTLARRWLDLAYEVGAKLADRGHTVVSGGGSVGMMGALVEGARARGGRTVGVIPRSLLDREVADLAATELVVTRDMGSRKTTMIDKSDAFLALPGGLGTLDELFEVWTTATLGLHAKPIVLLDRDGFYAGLLHWLDGLAGGGFAAESAMAHLRVVDSVAAALQALEAELDRRPGQPQSPS